MEHEKQPATQDPGMSASTEERFVAALEKIASAVEVQADSNAKLAASFDAMTENMKRMTATIQGAQRKIGGELGPLVDRAKETNRKLNEELQRARATNGAG